MIKISVWIKNSIRIFIYGIQAFFQPLKIRDMRLRSMGNASDRDALESDWIAVGNDIQKALANIRRQDCK